MSFRYKAGFIQEFFDPLTAGPTASLWSWGNNYGGSLGQNDTVNRSSPVQIGSLTTWSSFAACGQASAALKTDGTLWAWGYGGDGQIGNNSTGHPASPVQVGSLTTWISIKGNGSGSFNSMLLGSYTPSS